MLGIIDIGKPNMGQSMKDLLQKRIFIMTAEKKFQAIQKNLDYIS